MKKEFFIQELESLIRTLDFIQEEQAFIKRKLTNYIDTLAVAAHIAWAEDMQQQILNREAALQMIKKDISLLKASGIAEPLLLKKDKQQVNYLENEFIHWKHEIDQQLDSAISLPH
jgi:two-component SAPR family response regulator